MFTFYLSSADLHSIWRLFLLILQILQEIYEAYYWFSKRCEEYFLCKYQPPEGVKSVGEHVNLEISIYLQRFPPQQRQLRRLIFDYLLKRECCITGCDSMQDVDLIGIGNDQLWFLIVLKIFCKKLFLTVKSKKCNYWWFKVLILSWYDLKSLTAVS